MFAPEGEVGAFKPQAADFNRIPFHRLYPAGKPGAGFALHCFGRAFGQAPGVGALGPAKGTAHAGELAFIPGALHEAIRCGNPDVIEADGGLFVMRPAGEDRPFAPMHPLAAFLVRPAVDIGLDAAIETHPVDIGDATGRDVEVIVRWNIAVDRDVDFQGGESFDRFVKIPPEVGDVPGQPGQRDAGGFRHGFRSWLSAEVFSAGQAAEGQQAEGGNQAEFHGWGFFRC